MPKKRTVRLCQVSTDSSEMVLPWMSQFRVDVVFGMNSIRWNQPPYKLTRCCLGEGVEAKKVSITASSQGDAIHRRRKSTTKFTFALGWRADYILPSKVLAKATRGGEKIVQEGSLRNSSMVS